MVTALEDVNGSDVAPAGTIIFESQSDTCQSEALDFKKKNCGEKNRPTGERSA